MNDFIALVKEGCRLAWNLWKLSVETIKDLGKRALETLKAAVIAYFRGVKKWTLRFFIAAVAPLIVIVPCLAFGAPFGALYGTYVAWVVLLLAAELAMMIPLFMVWRRVKVLFPTLVAELEEWLGFIRSVVFNGLSFAVFVAIFPIWKAPGSLPLLLLVVACWLTLPACSFSNFCKRIYPTVRGVQLFILFGLLVVKMAFPKQMEQRLWAADRTMGDRIAVNQQEVTADWKTQKWFNNVGEATVWYSGDKDAGYRLWAAPGYDPDSGKELKPIREGNTRSQIVAYFEAKARTTREREDLATTEKLRKEVEQRTRDEATARAKAAEQAAVEQAIERVEQQRIETERLAAAQTAAEQAVIQHASYLARYIQKPAERPDARIAVVVVTERQVVNDFAGKSLGKILDDHSYSASASFFTPAFLSDGLFEKSFGGSKGILDKLELTNALDAIVLGRESVYYVTNAALNGLITANLTLELSALSASTHQSISQYSVSASGPGFKVEQARAAAEERALKQLATEPLDRFTRPLPKKR